MHQQVAKTGYFTCARPKPLAKLGKITFLSGRSFMEYIRITRENIDLEHKHIAASMAKKKK